jgi:hypothetical protein
LEKPGTPPKNPAVSQLPTRPMLHPAVALCVLALLALCQLSLVSAHASKPKIHTVVLKGNALAACPPGHARGERRG